MTEPKAKNAVPVPPLSGTGGTPSGNRGNAATLGLFRALGQHPPGSGGMPLSGASPCRLLSAKTANGSITPQPLNRGEAQAVPAAFWVIIHAERKLHPAQAVPTVFLGGRGNSIRAFHLPFRKVSPSPVHSPYTDRLWRKPAGKRAASGRGPSPRHVRLGSGAGRQPAKTSVRPLPENRAFPFP